MRFIIPLASGLALLSFLLLLAAGPLHRLDVTAYRTGFTLMRWAAYGGIAAALGILAGLVLLRPTEGRALVLAVVGIALAAVTLYVPWSWAQKARRLPGIHDITTDLENPPAFEAILPLRRDAPNPAEYGGPEVAALQREAYPDIGPLILDAPPAAAFDRALAAARDLGWEVVASDPARGRVEATATTTWFGFTDDVVVRITAADGGSRVDVRSVSRVGRSDVGKNAQRIREYLTRLR